MDVKSFFFGLFIGFIFAGFFIGGAQFLVRKHPPQTVEWPTDSLPERNKKVELRIVWSE
jgi:hypothetical protein